LGAVCGLCGAGVAIQVTPQWSEPLVLWLALVGRPSSGRSPAVAPVRRLLASLQEETTQTVIHQSDLEGTAEIISKNSRGALLWCDEPSDWLMNLGRDGDRGSWLQAWSGGPIAIGSRDAQLQKFPVSIVGTTGPDRLARTLQHDDDLAGRFLYAWPHLPPHFPLADAKFAGDGDALGWLRRISQKAGTLADPLTLRIDERGIKAFDEFLARLHADLRDSEGLEAAWLGKARGTVARLAGVLELLAWSTTGSAGPPGHLGREQMESAVSLWENYFRPHAKALFVHAAPTSLESQARRVARWLKSKGLPEVTRETVRREALGRTVNASGADRVLSRLYAANIVRPSAAYASWRGRPPNRWDVNPALANA
jgi:hypothetical protein